MQIRTFVKDRETSDAEWLDRVAVGEREPVESTISNLKQAIIDQAALPPADIVSNVTAMQWLFP